MKTIAIAIFGALALAVPLSAGTTEAESEVFAFDTRDSVGTVVGESRVFGVAARGMDDDDGRVVAGILVRSRLGNLAGRAARWR